MTKIPSIYFQPSIYKENKLYCALPTNGDADLAFTRASEATRVNQNGLIETVGVNVPRLDHSDGGCPSLLVEPQSTNLVTYSENFSNAVWVKTDASVTSNSDVAPDGTTTADTITADANNVTIQQFYTGVIGTDYTTSFYIKRKTGTGVVSIRSVENVTTPITVTNEWTRVSLTTTSTTTTIRIGINLATSGDEVYVWGAQLEQQSYATSYIPTVAGTVTRVEETCSKNGLNSYINTQEGVLFLEAKVPITTKQKDFMITNGGVSDVVGFNFSDYRILSICRIGTVTQASIESTIDAGFMKLAFQWQQNNFSLYKNGVKIGEDLLGSVGSVGLFDTLSFNRGSFNDFQGELKQFSVYDSVLTEAELITLTTL